VRAIARSTASAGSPVSQTMRRASIVRKGNPL